MRKLATIFLAVAVYALMGIGVAAADDDDGKRQQKPDSIVSCQAELVLTPLGLQGGHIVLASGVPASVENLDQCLSLVDEKSECSDCIRSLEKQGCKIVDVTVNGTLGLPRTTFLLSCEKP